ncbi:MAG: chemotaxis protein CheW [Gammaproteobacteria bacterium]|nr:chemotaxis protein CheW [Gammaproteobacteria bacterium]
MVEGKEKQEILVEEKDAISVYLESLLRDVPEADEDSSDLMPQTATLAVEEPVQIPEPMVTEAVPAIETPEVAPTIAPPVESPVVDTPAPVIPEPEIVIETLEPNLETVAEPSTAVATESQWEGMPSWAEEDFQVLLFKLSGLNMALPLVELDGILEWPDSLTPMPNHAPWYRGLLDNRGKTLPVIELSQLVIPEKIRQKHESNANTGLDRIVLIGDSSWGIACDSVSEVITLTPDEVKWRTSRTRRKWLAGTVIDQMCALLDAQGLILLLANGEEAPAE